MKKSTVILGILLISLFLSNTSSAQEQLKWYSFNEGYEKAKQENKIMLIDVYTDWCGWCKKMDKDTYAKTEVISSLNKNFIAVKLNPENPGEYTYNGNKYDGARLVKILTDNKLSGYPTTCFLFPKKNASYMEVGYMGKDNMLELLKKYVGMK